MVAILVHSHVCESVHVQHAGRIAVTAWKRSLEARGDNQLTWGCTSWIRYTYYTYCTYYFTNVLSYLL